MKKGIGIVIFIVIVIISLGLSIYLPNKDKINDEAEDKSVIYSVIAENGKYGVKNQDEKVIVKPQYEQVVRSRIPRRRTRHPFRLPMVCRNTLSAIVRYARSIRLAHSRVSLIAASIVSRERRSMPSWLWVWRYALPKAFCVWESHPSLWWGRCCS